MKKILLFTALTFIALQSQEQPIKNTADQLAKTNAAEISIKCIRNKEHTDSPEWRQLMLVVHEFMQEAAKIDQSNADPDLDKPIDDKMFQLLHLLVDHIDHFQDISDQPVYGIVDAAIGQREYIK